MKKWPAYPPPTIYTQSTQERGFYILHEKPLEVIQKRKTK